MGIKGASRLLLLGILGCFNALASSAQATTDEGTRVSQALSQQADVLFIQRYLTLTPDERSEVKDVLTTPFKSWDVIDQIADIFLQDPGSQTHSLKWALKNWIEENPLPEDDTYSHLRFVGLKNSPSSVKILFEKGVCIHDGTTANHSRTYRTRLAAKSKKTFRRPTKSPSHRLSSRDSFTKIRAPRAKSHLRSLQPSAPSGPRSPRIFSHRSLPTPANRVCVTLKLPW